MSEKERDQLLLNKRKELISIVSSKFVHPETNRLFPPKIIEEAILSLGFDVKMNDPAKKQANFLIKELSTKYILKKADMEIKVSIREEWINEGEKAGTQIQPTIQKVAGLDDEDDDHEDHEQKPQAEPKPEKKDNPKAQSGKKKNKKADEEFEWDNKHAKDTKDTKDPKDPKEGEIVPEKSDNMGNHSFTRRTRGRGCS